MKKILNSIYASFILFLVFNLPVLSKSNCEYSYEPSKTKMKWIAFKFTEKTGVEGSFLKINMIGQPKGDSIKNFSEKVKFSIETASVSTNNPERDAKIVKFFFSEMKKTNEISGYFTNTTITGNTGTSNLVLKMNDIEESVPMQLIVKNNKEIELKGQIDLNNWKVQSSIQKLNKECDELHKGKDGISKLWNDVDISLSTELKMVCK
jgi:polyisoprenoid-binding protein YceI